MSERPDIVGKPNTITDVAVSHGESQSADTGEVEHHLRIAVKIGDEWHWAPMGPDAAIEVTCKLAAALVEQGPPHSLTAAVSLMRVISAEFERLKEKR